MSEDKKVIKMMPKKNAEMDTMIKEAQKQALELQEDAKMQLLTYYDQQGKAIQKNIKLMGYVNEHKEDIINWATANCGIYIALKAAPANYPMPRSFVIGVVDDITPVTIAGVLTRTVMDTLKFNLLDDDIKNASTMMHGIFGDITNLVIALAYIRDPELQSYMFHASIDDISDDEKEERYKKICISVKERIEKVISHEDLENLIRNYLL